MNSSEVAALYWEQPGEAARISRCPSFVSTILYSSSTKPGGSKASAAVDLITGGVPVAPVHPAVLKLLHRGSGTFWDN